MNISLTPELQAYIAAKVKTGLYNNASEVVRESLRIAMEQEAIRARWREQIEAGWQQAQRGELVDGDVALHRARDVMHTAASVGRRQRKKA